MSRAPAPQTITHERYAQRAPGCETALSGQGNRQAGRHRGPARNREAAVLKILLIVAVIAVVVFLVVPALRRRSGSRRGL